MRWILAGFLLAAPPMAKPETKITYRVDQASVGSVVQSLAAQAGLRYEREKGCAQTAAECQRWVRGLRLKAVPFDKAMTQVLEQVGLRYEVEGGAVVLYRSATGPLLTYS